MANVHQRRRAQRAKIAARQHQAHLDALAAEEGIEQVVEEAPKSKKWGRLKKSKK